MYQYLAYYINPEGFYRVVILERSEQTLAEDHLAKLAYEYHCGDGYEIESITRFKEPEEHVVPITERLKRLGVNNKISTEPIKPAKKWFTGTKK